MGIRDRVAELTAKQSLEAVDVPGFGEVYLRKLSAAEYDKLMAVVNTKHGGNLHNKANWRAWLVCQVLCEADGTRAFADGEEAAVGGLPSGVVQSMFDRFAAMNGMAKDAVEEIEGNSEGMPAGDSPSDLHLS
jgi:hypothetical protein